MKPRTIVLCGAALVLVGGMLTGCGNGEWTENADKGDRNVGPADVINFPHGFRNVAHKCDGPNMVYVASRGNDGGDPSLPSAVAVVANDPRCTGAR